MIRSLSCMSQHSQRLTFKISNMPSPTSKVKWMPGKLCNKSYLIKIPGLAITRGKIDPQTFPLPQALSEKLRSINDEVNNGRGFVVLRGLTASEYSEEDIIIVYAGLTSHVASHRAGFIGRAPKRPYPADMRWLKVIQL